MSPADAPFPSKDADAIWPVIESRNTELKYQVSDIIWYALHMTSFNTGFTQDKGNI